jgi:hypothetical protein
MPDCVRCGSPLEEGFCSDETCPFSTHRQNCRFGWAGHPEKDPHPNEDEVVDCDCQDREWAVGLKWEGVVHIVAPTAEAAQELAKADEETHGLILSQAEAQVAYCEEQ